MAPKTMKSVSSQFTSLVNCIATKGRSSRNAAVPQIAILHRLPRCLPVFSACPTTSLPPCISEAFNLAWAARGRHEQLVGLNGGGIVYHRGRGTVYQGGGRELTAR